jgi:uncharacterized protein (DUF433 family)
MATLIANQHIVATPGVAGGKPRIDGHRIRVQDVAVWHERLGLSVDEIVADYDLTPAQVHAALAYYFDHREEIDRSLAEDQEIADSLRQNYPSNVAERRKHLEPGPIPIDVLKLM